MLTRMSELNITPDELAFRVTNQLLFTAIADRIDLETVTNHELKEIFYIVKKQLSYINWQELVTHSIEQLPFGLNQTSIAFSGNYPCNGCPDAMREDNYCYHKEACKAWEIYEAHI